MKKVISAGASPAGAEVSAGADDSAGAGADDSAAGSLVLDVLDELPHALRTTELAAVTPMTVARSFLRRGPPGLPSVIATPLKWLSRH
jgi:hypothetical protein